MSSEAQNARSQSYALMHMFSKCYEKKYGQKPLINRYRERWGFQDMVDSIGEEDSKAVIEYYFEISSSNHTCKYLFNNFDILKRNLDARTQDREKRARLRQQTKERMELADESRS